MIFLLLLVPVITAIIFWYYNKTDNIYQKIIPIILIPWCIFFIAFVCCKGLHGSSTEYYGSYVTQITYYEPWNEEVTVTKTRTYTDSNGKTHEETYTTTEIEYHSEKYSYKSNTEDYDHYISKDLYKRISNRLKSEPIYKDMHRNYYTKDGDAYITLFDNIDTHMYTLTDTHSYWNPIKANPYTILGYTKISKEKADSLGLYEYPKVNSDNYDQSPIIGMKVPYWQEHQIRVLNSKYGQSKQFRMYILLFKDKNPEIAEYQKSYWYQGNKNELIICLGIKGDSVTWCRGFSWSDKPVLEIKSRDYFINHPKLNLYDYGKFIESNLKHWKRKEFKDFNYISVDLTTTQILIISILTIISTFILYYIEWNSGKRN
jgi:hypothetical protein